jgi:hypothetical protein
MGVVVAMNDDNTAKGQLFWDDGESIGKKNTIFMKNFRTVNEEPAKTRWSGMPRYHVIAADHVHFIFSDTYENGQYFLVNFTADVVRELE